MNITMPSKDYQLKKGIKITETRKSCSCKTAVRILKCWIGIADNAKKAEKLSITGKPVAEVLVEGIWSWNNNSGMI